MKKLITLLFAFLLVTTLAVSAAAAEVLPYLVDEADLLTPAQEAELEEKLADLSEKWDMDIVVVTADEAGDAIAAVNKDARASHRLDLSVVGEAVTKMRIHTLNGPSENAYNDIDRTEVGITSGEWVDFDSHVVLPPHSVNVIEVK